jgi:flavin reductase (DIM6/NTAB) family NADH-FMN oxidoreductase RutF
VSGRDYDKFLITGLTRDKAVNSASPLIMEAGISLDCILKDIWKVGGHDVFIGKVLKIIDRTNKAQGFQDWLYHNKFTYYGREGRLGELYKVGRELIPK